LEAAAAEMSGINRRSARRAGWLGMAAVASGLSAMVEDSERGAGWSGRWKLEKGRPMKKNGGKGEGDREREAGKASEVKM
jgi:hypothetical protein